MSTCEIIHNKINKLERYNYPFYIEDLPKNGVYIIFENKETAHNGDRIVHIGTHNGQDELARRICEIFELENKNRSILRKNIGRCILNKENNPYLEIWDKDTTSAKSRSELRDVINIDIEKEIESKVTEYILNNLSFTIIKEDNSDLRKIIKQELISEISRCSQCKASSYWIGNHSTKPKIRESGLWNEQGLYKENKSNYILNILKNIN